MSFFFKTDESSSNTKTATFIIDEEPHPKLVYTYFSKPDIDSPNSNLKAHTGCGIVDIIENKKISGNYFNDFQRESYGKIQLEFDSQ